MNKKAASSKAKAKDEDTKETVEEEKNGAESKKGAEQKLDEMGEKFSKSMAEGVKRMEEAFDRSMKNLRENPKFVDSGWKGFLTSASGGMFLIVIGAAWLLVLLGVLRLWILPVILIALGFYFMLKKR